MKSFTTLYLHFMRNRASRRNLRVLAQFLFILLAMIVVYDLGTRLTYAMNTTGILFGFGLAAGVNFDVHATIHFSGGFFGFIHDRRGVMFDFVGVDADRWVSIGSAELQPAD